MSTSPHRIFFKIWVLITVTLLGAGIVSAATKTLTIKGSNSDSGDTIQIPDSAQVNLQVADEGITIVMPDLNLRLRCLGEVTDDGYCYVAAGGAGGGTGVLNDFDGDRVPDDWDQCQNTPRSAPILTAAVALTSTVMATSPQRTPAPTRALRLSTVRGARSATQQTVIP